MSDKNEPGVIAIGARQPLVYGNITDIYTSFRDPVPSEIKSWMGVPLVARDRVIGLISIDHVISNAYSDEDVQLAVAFANQAAIAIENARLYEIEVREIERELDIAHQIQSTLLPQYIPQIPGLDIVGRIIPARQVGGDFFHFFSTAPDQLGVAIGDVSGKGIPAALYMAAGITAIDTQIGTDLLPGELLNNLNKMLYNRLHENKMNIALQIATFIPLPTQNDDQSGEQAARGSLMTVASAGMIAPVGATEFGCRFLPVSGLPIGALPDAQIYADDVFLLDPLTTIIFTSDGIVEAQNEVGELFGFERLEETILEIISKRNAEQIADHIIHRTQQFIGHAEQHDDMTVVVVVKK
jgi:serine phosphatase RsbU (regulator of sigma subunit)